MSALKKKIRMKASPIGILTTAFIDRPSTKFKKEGQYSADLRVAPDDLFPGTGKTVTEVKAELEAFLEEYAQEAIAEKPKYKQFKDRRLPIFEEIDEETGDPTGMLIIRAGQAAKIKTKDGVRNVTIDLYNAKGQAMKPVPIGRGSKARIAGTIRGYVAEGNKQIGLTMYLEGVKLIDLVKPGGRNAEGYGFDDEDEGYDGDGGSMGLDDDDSGMDGDDSDEGSGSDDDGNF